MHADPAQHQHPGLLAADVLEHLLEGFAVQQRGLDVLPFGLGDLAADVEVRLVDLGQPAVNDLLMQLFLLLEAEDLAGLLVEDAGDAVEGGVVEVGIEGRDGLDRLVQGLAERQRGLEAAERKVAAVQRDQDGAAVHRQGVLDDEDVRRAHPPDHAFRDAADDAVLHGAHAQGAHDDEVVGVGVDVFDEDLEVPAFQRPPFDRNVRLGGLLVYDIQVGVGDDLQAAGDQRIVDLPLPLEFVFVVVFLGEARFHLLEALVVHLGRVHVAAHEFGPERLRQRDSDVQRQVRIVGVVDGDVNRLIHTVSLQRQTSYSVLVEGLVAWGKNDVS